MFWLAIIAITAFLIVALAIILLVSKARTKTPQSRPSTSTGRLIWHGRAFAGFENSPTKTGDARIVLE